MTVDFAAARVAVTGHLAELYADDREHPTVLPYGWDTGDAWAPAIDWDGIAGTYVWLVDKTTGELSPRSFPEFLDMPDPDQVGPWPEDTLTAAAGGPHTGAMVALIPADPDMLEVPDGEPADQLHCTLLFLGEATDLDADTRAGILQTVQDIADSTPEVTADGFGLAVFNPYGEDPCLVLLLSGAELADLHETVAEDVEASAEQHRPWIPHITLAYTSDDSMISDLLDRCGPVVFDRLRVAFADEVTDFPLLGTSEDEVEDETVEDVPAEPVPVAVTTPPTMTAGNVRVRWDGCPRCFAPVHEGPCPIGL